jgi:hypothetical protein
MTNDNDAKLAALEINAELLSNRLAEMEAAFPLIQAEFDKVWSILTRPAESSAALQATARPTITAAHGSIELNGHTLSLEGSHFVVSKNKQFLIRLPMSGIAFVIASLGGKIESIDENTRIELSDGTTVCLTSVEQAQAFFDARVNPSER